MFYRLITLWVWLYKAIFCLNSGYQLGTSVYCRLHPQRLLTTKRIAYKIFSFLWHCSDFGNECKTGNKTYTASRSQDCSIRERKTAVSCLGDGYGRQGYPPSRSVRIRAVSFIALIPRWRSMTLMKEEASPKKVEQKGIAWTKAKVLETMLPEFQYVLTKHSLTGELLLPLQKMVFDASAQGMKMTGYVQSAKSSPNESFQRVIKEGDHLI